MNRIIITPNDFGGVDEVVCKWFKCPKCEGKIRVCFKFCSNCGVRLRWKLHQKPIK